MAKPNFTETNLGQTVIQPAFPHLGERDHGERATEKNAHGAPESDSGDRPPVSAKPIALIEGSLPDFTRETNSLLRDRLRQVSLIFFIGYTAFFIKSLVYPSHNYPVTEAICLSLMALTIAINGVIAHRLCNRCHYVLKHLRGVEALIFGSSAVLFLAIGYAKLLATSNGGYLEDVTPPWLLLIFSYALFIPNSWQRAARMITPMALGPLVAILAAWVTSPKVKDLIENSDAFHHVFLETIMAMAFASTLAIGGVRLIRNLRSQAFEAQQLGQYRLKRLIGRGGMGEVYLAEHLMLKRPCAIKLIRPEKAGDPATLARFEREVQSTAKLTHWNTVEIYDFGRTDDGTFYYVMEYLPGMSLDQIVEMHGPLEASRVLHLLVQTCDALAESHAHSLVHRDIKPANIFAARRGGTDDVAKLLDFGLVRSTAPETSLHLTQESVVTGSPLYMSPEQARGDEADHRSDIYALGCTAYFLLTGRPPFDETSAVKLLLAHAQKAPEPPSVHRSSIPQDLEAVILKCLEKSQDQRYSNVLELRDALTSCRDYGGWNRQSAYNWWTDFGCPKKRDLDHRISQGLALKGDSTEEHIHEACSAEEKDLESLYPAVR
ncbi:MAG TPA: serine/threonine-protein kinase [Planctomicrobium sp.]|nr:serine/threonine-protein kinase [Planctomicrobium sp.]